MFLDTYLELNENILKFYSMQLANPVLFDPLK